MRTRCLIIQLDGRRALFRSLMALRAAHQAYPDLELAIVVREKDQIAQRVPWIQTIFAVPGARTLNEMQGSDQAIVTKMGSWAMPLLERAWDYVVNWSTVSSGSYIAALAPGKVKLGRTRSAEREAQIADGWTQYHDAIVRKGFPQDIHEIDLFTTQLLTCLQIHQRTAPQEPRAAAGRAFFKLSVPVDGIMSDLNQGGRQWLALQFESKGTWDPASWAVFLKKAFEHQPALHVTLLGDRGQLGFATGVLTLLDAELRSRVVNLVGKTDFDLWAAVLSRCHWVVAENQSASALLAALLGTQVIALGKEAEPSANEGPYGNGHIVVLPKGTELSPISVFGAWTYAAGQWAIRRALTLTRHLEQMELVEETAGMRVFRTRIRAAEEGGGVILESLMDEPLSYQAWSAQVMGQVAGQWFCGWTAEPARELRGINLRVDLFARIRQLLEVIETTQQAAVKCLSLARIIDQRLAKRRRAPLMAVEERADLEAHRQELSDTCQLFSRLGALEPSLGALDSMLVSLRDEDSVSRVEDFEQILEGLDLIRTWGRKTLELARPQRVAEARVLPFTTVRAPG